MSRLFPEKADLPVVYASDGLTTARRPLSAIVKAAMAIILLPCCLVLILQVVRDKQSYDSLLSKYNAIVAQKDGLANPPIVTLANRAIESSNATLVYTTTTVTQGTTVTLQTTASPSQSSASTTSPGECAPPMTITITAEPSFSAVGTPIGSSAPEVSFVSINSIPSSSLAPVTVVETHVTTSTIFVTASGLVTRKPDTLTLTATATELQTATEIHTVHEGGTNGTATGTSTSTADGIFSTSISSGIHTPRLTHYPNTTAVLSPYGTGYGGIISSTASYVLTIPAGTVGSTGRLTMPPGTTTSQVDPVSTVVTVSGGSKTNCVLAGTLTSVLTAAILLL